MKHAVVVQLVLTLAISVFGAAGYAQPLDLGLPKTNTSNVPPGEELILSGEFKLTKGSREGVLSVTAAPAENWYTYSMTQDASNGGPSIINVADSPDYSVDVSKFEADRDYKEVLDAEGGVLQKHTSPVTWTAPLTLSDDVDPEMLTISARFEGQVCAESGVCIPILGEDVPIKFAGYLAEPKATGSFRDGRAPVEIRGHVDPKAAVPGGTVKLVLQAIPNKQPEEDGGDYHIYAMVPRKEDGQWPTVIALTKTGDAWAAEAPTTPAEIVESPKGDYHKGDVEWTLELAVPAGAELRDYTVSGIIGYQVCNEGGSCDRRRAVRFTVKVPVASEQEEGQIPLTFTESTSYQVAEEEAQKMQWYVAPRSEWDDKPVLAILGLALLAGLILNVMPCVLPVIGLKIMSFVEQAGGNRWEIFSLNMWFSAGLLSVFMVLAILASALGLAWGEHFGDIRFAIVMISIVFVFGLSFLGVWEIPIPGFVGGTTASKVAEKEGAIGAFSKGILTTILATPCAGPFIVPATSWAVSQPTWMIFSLFACIGLGMAAPYLLIGAFPKLIAILPKPGAWMNTFKQVMGFVLMGTVVFLFSSLDSKYAIPVLTLLVGLAVACWWIGRTPLTAELGNRVRAWAVGGFITALVAMVAFGWMINRNELNWEPYSRVALDDHRAAGRTVLVDFTADW